MLNNRVVYLGGEFRSWDEANVHIMSHSFGRGSAIFEVIGFHETPAGPAVFRLDEHVTRFRKSAALLEMEPPLTTGELHEAVLETIRRNGLKSGVIKMMGFCPSKESIVSALARLNKLLDPDASSKPLPGRQAGATSGGGGSIRRPFPSRPRWRPII